MLCKTLIDGLFSVGRRLARGLLRSRRRILRDTLLYALAIYGVGCIIPTQLDPEAAQPNIAPMLVGANPVFGPLTRQASEHFDFTVTVNDPDDNTSSPPETIHARLFFADQTTSPVTYKMATTEDITLPPFGDGTLRQGTFMNETLCFDRGGTTLYLYVFVADRPFNLTDPTQVQVMAGGGIDSNYWVLTCT
jgi:hypothetical protein